ncbi:MAG TPA: hypothetical protein PKA58_25575, partial [Polyangium sp.]|nr:hypothetical protein [Polyangium sp.]
VWLGLVRSRRMLGFTQTHSGLRAPRPAQGAGPLTLALVRPADKPKRGNDLRHYPDAFHYFLAGAAGAAGVAGVAP